MGLVRHRLHYARRKDDALGKPSADAGAVGTDLLLVSHTLATVQVRRALGAQRPRPCSRGAAARAGGVVPRGRRARA